MRQHPTRQRTNLNAVLGDHMKAFLVCVILLWSASAWAQQLCFTQLGNVPADIIQFRLDWTHEGSSSFSYAPYINGSRVNDWPSAHYVDGDTVQYTASTYNDFIEYDIIGEGNQGGWQCRVVASIIGHVDIDVSIIGIDPRKKHQAQDDQDTWRFFSEVLGDAGALSCGKLPGATAVICGIVVYKTVNNFFADWIAQDQHIIDDPWDGNYGEAPGVNVRDYSDGCDSADGDLADYCRWVASLAGTATGYLEAAAVGGDRAQSAKDSGDLSAARDRTNELNDNLRNAGEYITETGAAIWRLGDWAADYDSGVADFIHNVAGYIWQRGNGWRQ